MPHRAPNLFPLFLASAVYNLLLLTGPLYLLNLYDKVIEIRSLSNFARLGAIALAAFALLLWIDKLRVDLLDQSQRHPLLAQMPSAPAQLALIDLPFLPLFLIALALLHPLLAVATLSVALLPPLSRLLPVTIGYLLNRFVHFTGQSVVAATAAYLVVTAGLSSGVIFAAAVLGARLWAPLEALALLARSPAAPKVSSSDLYSCKALPAPFNGLTLPTLQAGQAICLLGPTGSGKTRLLLELSGRAKARVRLAPPESHQSLFAYLEAHSPQSPCFTGSDAHIAEALALFGLSPKILTKPFSHLATGEQKLLQLAQSFHLLPRNVFLDMPETDLDPPALDFLCGAILRLKAQGSTFFIATHNPQLAALCEHRISLTAAAQNQSNAA